MVVQRWRFCFPVIILIGLYYVVQLHYYIIRRDDTDTDTVISKLNNLRNLRFYIYEWPVDVINATPKTFTHHHLSFTAPFLQNNGAGELIDQNQGLYRTHQYSLFLLVYNRLLQSPLRTLDPEHASLFFVPYDLGMDGSTRSSDGALYKTNCPRVGAVISLLKESPYFQKRGGSDHFLVHSINQMMLYYATPQCTALYELCLECTKLSIDVYPTDLYVHLTTSPHMTHKWLSVPFPSDYHYSSAATHPPWKQLSHQSIDDYFSQRPYALCFVGSVQVTAKKQRALRQAIVAECQSSQFEKTCLLNVLNSHDSTVDRHSISKSPRIGDEVIATANDNPYAKSRLCLSPGGDFPTRKGFLDAMLSGCVPVTFQLVSAQTQWPLHWISFENAMKSTIFMPRETAMKNMTSAMESLVAMSKDRELMSRKLQMIAEIAHRFQYSLPTTSVATERDAAAMHNVDALDVILDHLFNASSTHTVKQ